MKPIRNGIQNPTPVPGLLSLLRPGVIRLCLGGAVLASIQLAPAQNAPAEPLRTAAQVRALTPQQAGGRLPVRLKGVVTFWSTYSRFIQDETAGIYLLENTNLPAASPGQTVEVEGLTSAGEYAPIIIPSSVKVVGDGNLPAAKPVSVEDLLTGQEDSQFVELSGIVRAVKVSEAAKQCEVDLVSSGERFTVRAGPLPAALTSALVDSKVKVRGVCSTLFNRQRQLFGFRVLVGSPANIVLEQPAPANPFEAPSASVGSLLQFTSRGSFGHRVKLTGTVVYHEPGSALFIQDDKEGVYCQTKERNPLKAGDRVEVLGFPAKGEYTPVLQDAVYRKLGEGVPPEPAKLDVDEVLAGTHDCRLIQLTANLVERTERGRERFLVLEQGGFIFNAYLGQDIGSGLGFAPMQNGSEVSVAGLCLIERGANWRAGESWRANSFRLLLRSPGDVVVLKAPPWWTRWGVGRIIGILVVIILAKLLWISVLHRRIDAHRQNPAGSAK
jgi:hypothetical protein